jgi:hypothetical protein
MPTVPIRKHIVQAVIDRLRTIRRVNGYETDAGQNLIVGAIAMGPDDPNVGLSLVPEQSATADRVRAKAAFVLPLQIGAIARVLSWAQSDDAWLRAEDVIGDVHQAMETDDFTVDGRAFEIRLASELPLERGEGEETVGAALTYEVIYARGWGTR